jgi:flagellar motor switch protein FliM
MIKVPMPFAVELGKASIRGRELMNLEMGDIIILDKKITEPVSVAVAGHPMFLARPGRLKDQLCVKICDKIRYDEDDFSSSELV